MNVDVSYSVIWANIHRRINRRINRRIHRLITIASSSAPAYPFFVSIFRVLFYNILPHFVPGEAMVYSAWCGMDMINVTKYVALYMQPCLLPLAPPPPPRPHTIAQSLSHSHHLQLYMTLLNLIINFEVKHKKFTNKLSFLTRHYFRTIHNYHMISL